ncbi:unnamed protein product, partial [Owenia fusiformis]
MDYSAEPKAKCDILETFVVTFRNNARDIMGWRENFNCETQCGENEVYMYDGPGCEEHCVGNELRSCEEPDQEGCFCKTGYVRCRGKCIITDRVDCTWGPWSDDVMCSSCNTKCTRYCLKYRKKNPARNHGKDCVGPSLTYAIRDCTTEECVETSKRKKRQTSEVQLPKVCRGTGDVHYFTFDGLKYDFQGVCKYTLVEDITF